MDRILDSRGDLGIIIPLYSHRRRTAVDFSIGLHSHRNRRPRTEHRGVSAWQAATHLDDGPRHFHAKIDDETETIEFDLDYSGIEGGAALFAHIHFASRHVNGGVVVFLCGGGTEPAPCPMMEGTVTGVIVPSDIGGPAGQGIEAMAFAEFVRAIRSGYTYVNVHSPRWTTGEIRGQIRPRDRENDEENAHGGKEHGR